ncbi:MAG: Gfo/Idh/MocA family oxidoreductase [Myxococcota bacterium]
MKTLDVGLIGLGRHGRRYAEHLVRGDVPGARLAGFWRRDTEAAKTDQEALGVPSRTQVEDLIGSVDALVIVVPAAQHLPLAGLASAAGKPALIEKPLAPSAADADALLRLPGRFMVSQTLRFDPLVLALREAYQSGRFGPAVGFELVQRLEPRGLAWEDDPAIAGGGVLIQTGIHGLDALRFIFGAPRIEVEAATLRAVRGRRTEDHALLHLSVGGVVGQLATSKIGRSRHHRFSVFFEGGGLEADFIARTLTTVEGRSQSKIEVPEAPTVVRSLSAFCAWIRGEIADCPVSVAEAHASLLPIFEAYQRSGRSSV